MNEQIFQACKELIDDAKKGCADLVFKEIQIGEGPRLKRGRAASRGMWHPFKRRMSHIRVILQSTKAQVEKKEKKPAEAKMKEVKK